MINSVWVFIAIAVIVYVITVLYVAIKKDDFSTTVRNGLVGILLVITVLMIPNYQCNGKGYDLFTNVLFSLLFAIRALSGSQAVDMTHNVSLQGVQYVVYYFLLYVSFIIAPVFTTGFLVSIFGNASDRFKYFVSARRKIYFFSDLNENAICLAESIRGRGSKAVFVFCNYTLKTADKDTDLIKRVRKVNGIILRNKISEVQIKKCFESIRFFLISNTNEKNIDSFIWVANKYNKRSEKDNIKIDLFASGTIVERIVDTTEKGKILVRIVDETKYTCYNLLDTHPLYKKIKNNTISIMIVGGGYTGTELLKACLWCGQTALYGLTINMIDRQANRIKNQLESECPEIFSSGKYNINFYECDVKSSKFVDLVEQSCEDTTYAILSMKEDELNIETALKLKQIFVNLDADSYSECPLINVRVRKPLLCKIVDGMKIVDSKLTCEFNTFGCIDKVFNAENVLNSRLENMAQNVHLAYCNCLNAPDEEVEEALKTYHSKTYNQKASFAAALHMKYKLFAAGLPEEKLKADDVEVIRRYLSNPKNVEFLAMLEHERWNAFERTEGYSRIALNEVSKYYYNTAKRELGDYDHIHHIAKRHPTIVEWDELDEASRVIGELKGKEGYSLKNYDRYIVKKIPDIILTSEGDI